VPPMENHNLNLQVRKIRNPYPQMVNFLLKKYPDLRFQDCYVDGNDWSVGNDTFRDDHPVMQFVARQLDFMNQGLSKKEAFRETEKVFRERREYLEREQKVMMAMALNSGLAPMFSTGRAYLEVESAKSEAAHLQGIRRQLRSLKQAEFERQEEERRKVATEKALAASASEEEGHKAVAAKAQPRRSFAERRSDEQERLKNLERQRMDLVGDVSGISLDAWGQVLPEETSAQNMSVSQAEEATSPDDMPADLDVLPTEAVDKLISDDRRETVPDVEEQVPSTVQASARVPDIEEAPAIKPRPELVEVKPEDSFIVSRRSPQQKRRDKISSKDFGAMLRGGVQGEDKEDDYASDLAARRSRRQGSLDFDDDADDGDEFVPGRRGRGGGRR